MRVFVPTTDIKVIREMFEQASENTVLYAFLYSKGYGKNGFVVSSKKDTFPFGVFGSLKADFQMGR
jgi:hypothetical protein